MKDLFIQGFGKPWGPITFQLLEAAQFTIYLSLIAFIGGGIFGGLITLARIGRSKIWRSIATGYIWLFQSVPLLMLLFLSGLGVPRLFQQDINPWTAAIISLTLYASAYLAEVWRGAIQSLPEGQWEGGYALGLNFRQTLLKVVLPQAITRALAPTVGFMVQIIKGTSLAYIIGFHDLMAVGRRWANAPVEGTEPFVIYPIMACMYFALCFPLSLYARRLETRLGSYGTNPVAAAA